MHAYRVFWAPFDLKVELLLVFDLKIELFGSILRKSRVVGLNLTSNSRFWGPFGRQRLVFGSLWASRSSCLALFGVKLEFWGSTGRQNRVWGPKARLSRRTVPQEPDFHVELGPKSPTSTSNWAPKLEFGVKLALGIPTST